MGDRTHPSSPSLSIAGAVLWSVGIAKNPNNRTKIGQDQMVPLIAPGVAHTVPHIDEQLRSRQRR